MIINVQFPIVGGMRNTSAQVGDYVYYVPLAVQGAFDVDVAIRQAEQKYVTQKEQDRIADLYGLSIDRLSAADKARATARSGFISGIGSAAAGVAGTFMPGGVNYGAFTPGSMHPNQTIYDPVHGGPMSPNPDYDPTAPTGGLWPYTPTGS